MIRIHQTNLDCNKPKHKPAFCAQATQSTQTNQVPDVLPSYNVKIPMTYKKSGELKLPYDYTAHCYKLVNGQKVIIVPKEGETVVKTYVSTGSMNEPDKVRGISHYIEHNLFNGSDGLEAGEFFKTTDEMGASTNASTGFAETNYYISSNLLHDEDLEKKIKIHASMLETPKFATEMLEKEKGIVNSEINMILGYADNIVANETLRKLYNIQSSSKDLIGGTTNNITNLTREDVIDYYNNNYYPANMVTVITGEIEPEKTVQLLAKYFNAPNKISHQRKFEDLKPIEKTVRQDIISDKATATYIMLGFNGPQNKNAQDIIHIQALSELLTMPKTGRIDIALKNLNTSADFQLEKVGSRPQDNKAILLDCRTSEDNSEKVLKRLFAQINSAVTTPPTDEELQTIKKNLINNYSQKFEVSHFINNVIGESLLDGCPEVLTDYEKIVNSMTKEDITNAAKKYLDLNKTVVTVLHPQTANENSINENYKNTLTFTGNLNKRAINPDNLNRYVLSNNFDVITNDTKTNNTAFNILFNTEETPKNIKPALKFILSEMLNEGSMFKDDYEFFNNLQKDSISMYFKSGIANIKVNSTCASEDLEKALKNAKEVIQHPRFTQENLDFVKQQIYESFSNEEKYAEDKLYKELLGEHPAGWTKNDILNSIDKVSLDDVKALYSHIINTSQGRITVSAPFEKKPELKNVVFSEINKLNTVKPAKPFLEDTFKPVLKTKVLTDNYDKNQAEIIEAFKFKTNRNLKDDITVDLLNIILGGNASSRLFNDLREKQQLAYRVNSEVNYYDNSGIFQLFISTTTENKETGEISYDNIQKSIEGFNKHIEKIKNEKISQEELENAKLNMKNIILSDVETTTGKNNSLAVNSAGMYGVLADNETLKLIDKITVDDIYNAANYIFSNKPTYSILATTNTLKANENYFKSLA